MSIRVAIGLCVSALLWVGCGAGSPVSPEVDESVPTADAASTVSVALTPLAARQVKYTICHVPPGNPENAHEITVAEAALPAHFPHGDTLGTCEGDPPPPVECAGDCSLLDLDCCVDRIDCSWSFDELENGFCEAAEVP